MTPTIGFIGGGNMSRSLVGGLISDGYESSLIWVSNPTIKKVQHLQAAFGVNVTASNAEVCDVADVIVLSVKPQVLQDVAKEIRDSIQQRKPLVISVVAGIDAKVIEKWLGGNVAVVRTMPNTPALLGVGATGMFANQFVNKKQNEIAESIMRAVGVIVWVDKESMLDVVTAVSGCGPAYFFMIMEIMQKTAEEMGMNADMAKLLVLQTAFGASKMALESEDAPAQLREQVTSPNGVTEVALRTFKESDIEKIFQQALRNAQQRSQELAEKFGSEN